MSSDFDTSSHNKTGIAIFASGKGTNAENLIRYFHHHPAITICLLVTNNPEAGVCVIAKRHNIPLHIHQKGNPETIQEFIAFLKRSGTDYIVLAGYLKLLEPLLVKAFRHHILNIHPALLPKFGGKGMYGKFVHEKVLASKEKETGITIHEVNEVYDEGAVVFQKTIAVLQSDTAESIEKKVRTLEIEYFPPVIEKYILQKEKNS
jgi:phosphoribosylglycinamide formyltransferase-1